VRARIFLLALSLSTAPARWAAAQAGDAAAATALFQEGREAAKKGDYATACVKMEESYRLDAAPGTLLNLADCHEHLGQLATAWQRFTEATEKLPPTDNRLAAVKARVAALAPRLPRLTIALGPGVPAGTRVTRDGKEVGPGSLGTALPLDPGPHVVVAAAPGRQDRRYSVDLAEGRSDRVTVEPGAPKGPASSSPTEPTAPPPSSGPRPLVIAGAAIGGAGVITLVAAIGTGLALPAKGSTVSQNCGAAVHLPADQCNATGFAAAQSGQKLATANTATWIAGGVAAAAGVALVVVGLTRRDKPAPVEVGLAAGLGVARLEGRFR
jgi:hypothetical protein